MGIIKTILWLLWQLPQCLVGGIMYLFLANKELIRKDNYTLVYKASNMSGGISLGCFIFLDPHAAQNEATIRHELGHCKQSRMLGWLYLFVIGLPSLLWAAFGSNDKCYYSFYTESWANDLMHLSVRAVYKRCYLVIDYDEEE